MDCFGTLGEVKSIFDLTYFTEKIRAYVRQLWNTWGIYGTNNELIRKINTFDHLKSCNVANSVHISF